jgi:sulfur-oxidizing protein SoxY
MTEPSPNRRSVLLALSAGTLVAAMPARAESNGIEEAIRAAIGNARPRAGRVAIDLPPLAESGNSVPLKVAIDSPMTANDFVRRVLVFSDRNPRPWIATMSLGPRAGRAEVGTNIRLNGTQNVIAIAEMSDGTYWSEQRNVEVTIGACDSLSLRF